MLISMYRSIIYGEKGDPVRLRPNNPQCAAVGGSAGTGISILIQKRRTAAHYYYYYYYYPAEHLPIVSITRRDRSQPSRSTDKGLRRWLVFCRGTEFDVSPLN